MINPQFEHETKIGQVTGRIMPIYPLTAGINQKSMHTFIRQGLDECGHILPEALPAEVRQKYQLCDVEYAYENIHFPKDEGALEIARRRLVFEELFLLSAAMGFKRSKVRAKKGRILDSKYIDEFYAVLPFKPTNAQRRVIGEAVADMSSGSVMSRLVQGDVGSGKTAVAAACCFIAARNSCQALLWFQLKYLPDNTMHLSASFWSLWEYV